MPREHRATTARTGQAPSRDEPVKPSSTRPKEVRERNGCFTCRVRRKACSNPRRSHSTPEQYPSAPCDDCQRYGIQCLGYGFNRPEWLLEKEKMIRQELNKRSRNPSLFLDFSYLYEDEGWIPAFGLATDPSAPTHPSTPYSEPPETTTHTTSSTSPAFPPPLYTPHFQPNLAPTYATMSSPAISPLALHIPPQDLLNQSSPTTSLPSAGTSVSPTQAHSIEALLAEVWRTEEVNDAEPGEDVGQK